MVEVMVGRSGQRGMIKRIGGFEPVPVSVRPWRGRGRAQHPRRSSASSGVVVVRDQAVELRNSLIVYLFFFSRFQLRVQQATGPRRQPISSYPQQSHNTTNECSKEHRSARGPP